MTEFSYLGELSL